MSIMQGLCQYKAKLYAVWKGQVGDDQLYYGVFDGAAWELPNPNTLPGWSSVGPALAAANGRLYAAWKGESGDPTLWYASFDGDHWSGQTQIKLSNGVIPQSSVGPSLATLGTTLYAAWIGTDNDLSFSFASFDGSVWTDQTPSALSGAASSLGPSLAVIGSTLYAAWMEPHGQLTFASFDGSEWSGPTLIHLSNVSGPASSSGPSIAALGATLYIAWKGDDADQRLWYASFDPAHAKWSGQALLQTNGGSSIGPALAAFGTALYAMWIGENNDPKLWYAAYDGTGWSDQTPGPSQTGQDLVPPPSGGLGSNSNYILYSDCNPILNLAIHIEVTEDIVSTAGAGFSFQLNAYSPKGQTCVWQQYILRILNGPPQLGWQVDNWPLNAKNIINTRNVLTGLPAPTMPAKWGLSISLSNDGDGNVTGVEWSYYSPITDSAYAVLVELTTLFQISPVTGHPTGNLVTPAQLAPIIAFELNLVGPDGGSVVLSSGAGTITYSASTPLTLLSQVPPCTATPGTVTAETSNSVYGMLPPTTATTISQPFGVNNASTPMIRRLNLPRPTTPFRVTG